MMTLLMPKRKELVPRDAKSPTVKEHSQQRNRANPHDVDVEDGSLLAIDQWCRSD